MSFKIGAQLYSVREYTQTIEGLHDAMTKVKAMGYDYVQLSGQNQDIPAKSIRDALDQVGLHAPTTHISFELMQNDFENVVKNHRIMGVTHPGVGGMPKSYPQEGAAGYKQFAKDASVVAKKFKDEGMTFIYHNHHFEFANYDGVTGYEILLNESDPSVQFEMDTYWVQCGGGDPAAWIRKLKGRMDIVHFKDMQIIPGESDQYTCKQDYAELGLGNLNWQAIIEACKDTGVAYAFVEQDTTRKETPFLSLAISREFLKTQGL